MRGGYLSRSEGLEASEISSFAVAGPEMTVENAVRFLTDHLGGDTYFAVSRPDQNLDRCRTHLRLAELMFQSSDETRRCFQTRRTGIVTLPLAVAGPEALDDIAALCARSIANPPSVDELHRTLFAPDQPAIVRFAPGMGSRGRGAGRG